MRHPLLRVRQFQPRAPCVNRVGNFLRRAAPSRVLTQPNNHDEPYYAGVGRTPRLSAVKQSRTERTDASNPLLTRLYTHSTRRIAGARAAIGPPLARTAPWVPAIQCAPTRATGGRFPGSTRCAPCRERPCPASAAICPPARPFIAAWTTLQKRRRVAFTLTVPSTCEGPWVTHERPSARWDPRAEHPAPALHGLRQAPLGGGLARRRRLACHPGAALRVPWHGPVRTMCRPGPRGPWPGRTAARQGPGASPAGGRCKKKKNVVLTFG